MQFSTLTTLLVAGFASVYADTLERRAAPKANEYVSTDCSGALNYGHHSVNLAVVNMDPTSHSVYLAGGSWSGYTDYSRDVGHDGCSGENLGLLPGGCSDLDTPAGRIVCVST